jgi:hypothetical protein
MLLPGFMRVEGSPAHPRGCVCSAVAARPDDVRDARECLRVEGGVRRDKAMRVLCRACGRPRAGRDPVERPRQVPDSEVVSTLLVGIGRALADQGRAPGGCETGLLPARAETYVVTATRLAPSVVRANSASAPPAGDERRCVPVSCWLSCARRISSSDPADALGSTTALGVATVAAAPFAPLMQSAGVDRDETLASDDEERPRRDSDFGTSAGGARRPSCGG